VVTSTSHQPLYALADDTELTELALRCREHCELAGMNHAEWTSRPRRIVGIMTGTSLDGIDVALCTIGVDGDRHAIALDAFVTLPYSDACADLVRAVLTEQTTASVICDLDVALAADMAHAVEHLLSVATMANADVDLVAVHGQTMWHAPQPHAVGARTMGTTWQATNISALATLLDLPVIGDFRTADVVLGGQGAPLVPMFDLHMLRHFTRTRVALNIGGMANMTVLPPTATADTLVAFDTGPGNVLINAAIRKTYGKAFDTNGDVARAGSMIASMFEELTSHPYYAMQPPKSTGREVFDDAYAATMVKRYGHPSLPMEDLVRTITEVTAWSIAEHLLRYASQTDDVIVSGGGAHNAFLMERLRDRLPTMNVMKSDDVGIPSDAKEAMCFAYLGWRSMAGLPGNIPSVTGASKAVVLGTVSAS